MRCELGWSYNKMIWRWPPGEGCLDNWIRDWPGYGLLAMGCRECTDIFCEGYHLYYDKMKIFLYIDPYYKLDLVVENSTLHQVCVWIDELSCDWIDRSQIQLFRFHLFSWKKSNYHLQPSLYVSFRPFLLHFGIHGVNYNFFGRKVKVHTRESKWLGGWDLVSVLAFAFASTVIINN